MLVARSVSPWLKDPYKNGPREISFIIYAPPNRMIYFTGRANWDNKQQENVTWTEVLPGVHRNLIHPSGGMISILIQG